MARYVAHDPVTGMTSTVSYDPIPTKEYTDETETKTKAV